MLDICYIILVSSFAADHLSHLFVFRCWAESHGQITRYILYYIVLFFRERCKWSFETAALQQCLDLLVPLWFAQARYVDAISSVSGGSWAALLGTLEASTGRDERSIFQCTKVSVHVFHAASSKLSWECTIPQNSGSILQLLYRCFFCFLFFVSFCIVSNLWKYCHSWLPGSTPLGCKYWAINAYLGKPGEAGVRFGHGRGGQHHGSLFASDLLILWGCYIVVSCCFYFWNCKQNIVKQL